MQCAENDPDKMTAKEARIGFKAEILKNKDMNDKFQVQMILLYDMLNATMHAISGDINAMQNLLKKHEKDVEKHERNEVKQQALIDKMTVANVEGDKARKLYIKNKNNELNDFKIEVKTLKNDVQVLKEIKDDKEKETNAAKQEVKMLKKDRNNDLTAVQDQVFTISEKLDKLR